MRAFLPLLLPRGVAWLRHVDCSRVGAWQLVLVMWLWLAAACGAGTPPLK